MISPARQHSGRKFSVGARLDDPDLDVRRAAAATLARFGARVQAAQAELLVALADRDSPVRRSAADALLAIDSRGVALRRAPAALLSHEDPVVRNGAANEIANRSETFPGVVDHLSSRLHDPDENVRLAAARGLSRMGPEAAAAIPDTESLAFVFLAAAGGRDRVAR